MKKIFSILCVVSLVMLLVACGKKNDSVSATVDKKSNTVKGVENKSSAETSNANDDSENADIKEEKDESDIKEENNAEYTDILFSSVNIGDSIEDVKNAYGDQPTKEGKNIYGIKQCTYPCTYGDLDGDVTFEYDENGTIILAQWNYNTEDTKKAIQIFDDIYLDIADVLGKAEDDNSNYLSEDAKEKLLALYWNNGNVSLSKHITLIGKIVWEYKSPEYEAIIAATKHQDHPDY